LRIRNDPQRRKEMFAKVEVTFKATRYMDLSNSAEKIHGEIWKIGSDALKSAGFDVWLEELTLKQSDVMEAMRVERK